jgi:hypothetical protein
MASTNLATSGWLTASKAKFGVIGDITIQLGAVENARPTMALRQEIDGYYEKALIT